MICRHLGVLSTIWFLSQGFTSFWSGVSEWTWPLTRAELYGIHSVYSFVGDAYTGTVLVGTVKLLLYTLCSGTWIVSNAGAHPQAGWQQLQPDWPTQPHCCWKQEH